MSGRGWQRTTGMRRVLSGGVALAGLTAGCLLGACSPDRAVDPDPVPPSVAGSPAAGPSATRGGELDALTARGLVDALHRAGAAVPNPRDATAQECPAAGCDQAVVTDTLRVDSFATTGRAQVYAGQRGLFQVETVVVAFAPSVPAAQRDRYVAQIKALMH
ncbi:hypothetical protein ACN27E_03925 [Mycobacterium sp. WMMD1722]|uniref:hypothetical protein n=1 Tax=Mycobacterium sp. WMMD1722 TaxID=3404117 RepID=UPI003BF609D9